MSSAPSRQNINDDLSNASETRANCMIQTYKVDEQFKDLLFSYVHGILGILHALDETCFAYNPLAKSPIPRTTPPVALYIHKHFECDQLTRSKEKKNEKSSLSPRLIAFEMKFPAIFCCQVSSCHMSNEISSNDCSSRAKSCACPAARRLRPVPAPTPLKLTESSIWWSVGNVCYLWKKRVSYSHP